MNASRVTNASGRRPAGGLMRRSYGRCLSKVASLAPFEAKLSTALRTDYARHIRSLSELEDGWVDTAIDYAASLPEEPTTEHLLLAVAAEWRRVVECVAPHLDKAMFSVESRVAPWDSQNWETPLLPLMDREARAAFLAAREGGRP